MVRVPPKMMAGVRRSARTRGKSDPIDALAVARAVLREPDLPVARLDGPAREARLLVDYREGLVRERTAIQNRLRWRLHELEPGWDPPTGSLDRYRTLDEIEARLGDHQGTVADLACREVTRIREITIEANQLERDITSRVNQIAPTLLETPGCGALTAAKAAERNPRDIAEAIVAAVADPAVIAELSVAGPGFINITVTDEFLASHVQAMEADTRLAVPLPDHPDRVLEISQKNRAGETC